MNWVKFDDLWVNTDCIYQIWVKQTMADPDQFNIFALENNYGNSDSYNQYEIFNACFRTREEAQEYLDKFMKENFRK